MTDTTNNDEPITPTREQVAEAIYESRRDRPNAPHWPKALMHIREKYRADADAVLALFSQPSPSTEPVEDDGYLWRVALQRERDASVARIDSDSFRLGYEAVHRPSDAPSAERACIEWGTALLGTPDEHGQPTTWDEFRVVDEQRARAALGPNEDGGAFIVPVWRYVESSWTIPSDVVPLVTPPPALPEDGR